jgi:hypothetical protein
MPVFGPIVTDRKKRRFGVLDLEWVPGEILPLPVNTTVRVEGLSEEFKIPLPVARRLTEPLKIRLAGYYDQVTIEHEAEGEEPEVVERYQCFETVRDLIDFMLVREHRGDWFFAHAGGLADMEFVLDELLAEIKRQTGAGGKSTTTIGKDGKKHVEHRAGTWKIKASFSGSSAIIIHVIKGKNAWHFVDSYWLLRDKLANIGKAIGIAKGDTAEAKAWMADRFGRVVDDFDDLSQAEKVIFYREVPFPILRDYNRLDCEILWKAIKQFEDEIYEEGGQLQQTIASTAMGLFRRRFLKQDIYTSEKLNKIAEESYFASRVEVLSRNAEDFYIYDINSSFPFAMTFPLPANLIGFSMKLPDDGEGEDDNIIYLANVTIEVPEMAMPPLPYRKEGRVFFPTGKWRSWFTSTDIRLAKREGATIHKVHEVYVFEPFMDFKEYADVIYKKRANATTPFRKLVLKYLLNSLYGKAAESIMKQEMLINPTEIDRTKMQMLQPGVWLQEKEATIAHRHVAVSTVITAIARRTLYNLAKECYRQDHKLYYCDSITGDRTVVLRSPGGKVIIEPIERTWEKRGKDVQPYRYEEKEECSPGPGWTALAKDASGKVDWFPLKRIIRHKTDKLLHLIGTDRGQVEVTQDHSIMVGGKAVKPADFVEEGMQFDALRAPLLASDGEIVMGDDDWPCQKLSYRRHSPELYALFDSLANVLGYTVNALPSFVYELDDSDFEVFWDKLQMGSGNIGWKDRPRGRYYTHSQTLAAGLSFALDQHGLDHSIQSSPCTGGYVFRFGSDRGFQESSALVWVERRPGTYVYDLEVEGAHTFVDGLGRVLLHNTDSLATKASLPIDEKTLGALKLEKKMEWAEFIAPKIYRGEGYELDKGAWKPKKLNKAKGFSLGKGQEAFDKLGRIISGERIGVQRMTRLRELYRTQVGEQYTTAPFEMLVIKALTFESLCKRFHYPDGETRAWTVEELKSGDYMPKGFDFDKDILSMLGATTRAMLASAV